MIWIVPIGDRDNCISDNVIGRCKRDSGPFVRSLIMPLLKKKILY